MVEVKPALALPDNLKLVSCEQCPDQLTLTLVSTQQAPTCPCCGVPAQRIHSHYLRQVADLPCGGQRLCLLLTVRKFFCKTENCPRKIFAERLTPFIKPSARVTLRLFHVVQTLGLATGGRLGVRVTDRLSIQTSRTTILRRIMALPAEPVGQVTHVGIDDFSFRRGRKFGSILVDLQTHKVLEVLPDRTAETAASWMAKHPELEIISRDRGGEYAAAAKQAAPQATEVADRFHMYQNLTKAVELILARCRAEIRKGAFDALSDEEKQGMEPISLPTEFTTVENWKAAPSPCDERDRLKRHSQYQDRYAQVLALRELGLGNVEIAKRVGLTVRTLQLWQKNGFPETRRQKKRLSLFDPYASYVLSRWEQGCTNGRQIYQEIKARGYAGSEPTVYRFLVPLRRKQIIIQKTVVPHAPLQDFSAHDAVWLFVRDLGKLDEEEQATLAAMCQVNDTAATTYRLVQEFREMLHQRTGEKLDDWLIAVKESQIRELQSFAAGIERDKAAAVAGLTLPYHNGLVEGKVNKLKLIKRMGYGRAGFALLRQRILHAL